MSHLILWHIWRKYDCVQSPRYPKQKNTERKFQFIDPSLQTKLTGSEGSYTLKILFNHIFMAFCPYFTFSLYILTSMAMFSRLRRPLKYAFMHLWIFPILSILKGNGKKNCLNLYEWTVLSRIQTMTFRNILFRPISGWHIMCPMAFQLTFWYRALTFRHEKA